MKYIIKGYQPESMFRFFEQISQIPRGSGNEKEIGEYLVRFAEERNLTYSIDDMYNVVIRKAGTFGGEKSPAVMLQGHVDMVCEKNEGKIHDFEKDPIELVIKDGMLWADGTTLGADDGIAVAIMLAILDSNELVHPPLECVFTTQEETGLFGAAAIDTSALSAQVMINLDSEEEGIATVSCAGGMRCNLTRNISREIMPEVICMKIMIKGLHGGHSGKDINLGRGNANKLIGRILYHLKEQTDMKLVRVYGGEKENAIPREAGAVIAYTDKKQLEQAKQIVSELETAIRNEYGAVETGFSLTLTTEEQINAEVFSKADSDAAIDLIYLAPNGVLATNVKQDNFVVASINLGVLCTGKDHVALKFSPRSSVASIQTETKQHLALLSKKHGFCCEMTGEYPGWSYAEDSRVRDVFRQSFYKLYNKEMKIEAIHAGLECGLFIGKMPGLDAIAVGPDCYDCHTPQEHIDLASCERTWTLLTEVLRNLI